MSYRIEFVKAAAKQLDKLGAAEALRVLDKLDDVARDDPRNHPQATKLTARPGWRLRVGDYRVIFTVEDDELRVLKVGHRSDVYD